LKGISFTFKINQPLQNPLKNKIQPMTDVTAKGTDAMCYHEQNPKRVAPAGVIKPDIM
jgi:hypothetical protein